MPLFPSIFAQWKNVTFQYEDNVKFLQIVHVEECRILFAFFFNLQEKVWIFLRTFLRMDDFDVFKNQSSVEVSNDSNFFLFQHRHEL